MDRMMLISSDSHASPFADEYRPYLEHRFHDALDDVVAAQRQEIADRLAITETSTSIQRATMRDAYDQRVEFATKLEPRLKAQELDGIVGELVFPDVSVGNSIPFAGRFLCGVGPKEYEPELWTAGLRAYNRWLAEHAEPERQIGVGLVAFHDPDYALQQVHEVKRLGLRGIMPQWDGLDPSFLPLFHRDFDPVWSACVEEALPVTFHPMAGRPRNLYPSVDDTIPFSGPFISTEATQASMIFEAETLFWSRRTLWNMILGGVLERHPELQAGFVEMWTDWIPKTLGWLDFQISRARGRANRWEAVCPLLASEYWARQCFVGSHSWSLEDIAMRHELGVGTVTYGTDFPHANSPWQQVRPFLRATLGVAGVSEEDARLMLGLNMARIYHIDVEKLAPIVEEVGLLPQDVLQLAAGEDPNEGLSPYLRSCVHHPPTGAG